MNGKDKKSTEVTINISQLPAFEIWLFCHFQDPLAEVIFDKMHFWMLLTCTHCDQSQSLRMSLLFIVDTYFELSGHWQDKSITLIYSTERYDCEVFLHVESTETNHLQHILKRDIILSIFLLKQPK